MILFEILKIIAYILLLLLLVLLALVLLIICVPVFYKINFNSENGLKIKGDFKVLSGIVTFCVNSDSQDNLSIRLFGIPLKSIKFSGEDDSGINNENLKNEEELFNRSIKLENSQDDNSTQIADEPDANNGPLSRIKEKLLSLCKSFIETIKKVINTIRNTIKKIERIVEFLNDENVITAFTNHKSRVIKILKHLGPKKSDLVLNFGLEDPAMVGYILALISPFYYIYGNWLKIIPDFNNNTFKLDGNIKGRASFLFLLWHALRVYFDNNVKNIRNKYKTSGEGEY